MFNHAFGKPGDEPTWTSGEKDGVGTAYNAGSRVWFSLRGGHLTEVYYPTIDMPQVRTLRLLITDGQTFLDCEDDVSRIGRMCPALGYEITREPPGRGYNVEKVVIADPHLPCVLQRVKISGLPEVLQKLKVVVSCEPHLAARGAGNNAEAMLSAGRHVLVAGRGERHLAVGADVPFSRTSVGYVGLSDAATALARDFHFGPLFDHATDGNVALAGEIVLADILDAGGNAEFTVALAFGESRHGALTAMFQSLSAPFHQQASRFVSQWRRAVTTRRELEPFSFDEGNLYRASYSLLLGHEDKVFPGALIASLSIPWGNARTDEDASGGYHLVWTRDLVQSATALLAADQTATPMRTLIYLAVAQLPDGSFPQNFRIDGEAVRDGTQLDEVAFPIQFARRLHLEGADHEFDSGDMVRRAARFLLLRGPITAQERWEETSGYSPSTLTSILVACVCAASFATEANDDAAAQLLLDYADWIREHMADWTLTKRGRIVEGITRHFVRLGPAKAGKPAVAGDVDFARFTIGSQPPGQPDCFEARDIVDAGFLELVRHGILAADDPLVVDSLKVVDAVLKRETPRGIAWTRYTHDGYGQQDDGAPLKKHGVGRPWPLLAGERAHYELVAGNDPAPLIRSMEGFGGCTGLISEQVWDGPELPAAGLKPGFPTGAAQPLLWAHSEYIKLLRSVSDGVPYDRFPEVARRYLGQPVRRPPQYWSFDHPTRTIQRGDTLRIVAAEPFRLHYSSNGWAESQDADSASIFGLHVLDVTPVASTNGRLVFTMFWPRVNRWEGRDLEVAIDMPTPPVEKIASPAAQRSARTTVGTKRRAVSRP